MFDATFWRQRLAEMRRILETDRKFLLSGQIEKLARQDKRRGALEAKLHEMPNAVIKAETKSIDQLRRLALRNHNLLKAYIEGARRATRRLGVIEENKGRIGAYKADGTRIATSDARSTKQQRA